MLKNKNVRILFAIILSFFASVSIFCNRNIEIKNKYDFIDAISCDVVCSSVIVILLSIVFYKLLSKRYQKNIIISSFILCLIFSLCELIGFFMDKYSAFFNITKNFYAKLFNFIVLLGYMSLLFPLAICVLNYFSNNEFFVYNKSCNKYKYFSDNIQSFFFVWIFLIVSWGFYYLIYFPGVVTWDSYYQIEQGLGFRPITDENPFLHTLIECSMIKLGNLIFGNINAGIAFFAFVQMITIAAVVAFLIKYLSKKQTPDLLKLAVVLFYSLHPVIAVYSVTLWKDIWIGTFALIYIVFLFEICDNSNEFFQSKLKVCMFILSVLCVLFAKGTGIIIVVLSFPTLFVFAQKYWRQLLFSAGVCSFVFLLVRLVVIPGLNIKKGHIREPLSVPIQQMSRTVKYHKDSLTEYEYNTINEILPVEKLAELYNPKLSDNTKGVFNEQNFTKNKIKYIRLWINLGKKHPKTYLDSFLANSYGYWYPETIYWIVSESSYKSMLDFYKSNNWEIYDRNYDNYDMSQLVSNEKEQMSKLINNYLRKISAINLFFSIGVYFGIDLICMLVSIIKKKYKLISIFLAVGATFLICICSPVHAEFRYAYAALFTLPMIIIYTLYDFNKGVN